MPTPVIRTITLSGVGTSGGGGGGGTNAGLFGETTLTPVAGLVQPDIAALGAGTTCFNFRVTLSGTALTIGDVIWTGGTLVAGIKIWVYVGQDGSGDRDKPIWVAHGTGVNGYTSDVMDQEVDPTASTWTVYLLAFHGTIWSLDFVRTKVSFV